MSQEKNKDDFWDLESLLPARKKTSVSAGEKDTQAVEIYQSAPTLKGATATESMFVEHPVSLVPIRERAQDTPLYRYRPQNTLLHEARVFGAYIGISRARGLFSYTYDVLDWEDADAFF